MYFSPYEIYMSTFFLKKKTIKNIIYIKKKKKII